MKLLASSAVLSLALCANVAFAQTPPVEQAYMPPMIPHAVQAYLPITPEKNMCLLCHKVPAPGAAVQKVKGMPTALPPSHVSNGKVNPNRYECMLCHAEAAPKEPAPK